MFEEVRNRYATMKYQIHLSEVVPSQITQCLNAKLASEKGGILTPSTF